MRDDVVISGMSVVTGLGVGCEATLAALRREKAAFGPIRSFDTSGYPIQRGAEAMDPEEAFPGLDLGGPRRDRVVRHLLGTGQRALEDAGLFEDDPTKPRRREAYLGSTLVNMLSAGAFLHAEHDAAEGKRSYRMLAEWPTDNTLHHLAQRFQIEGLTVVVSNACASGAVALQLGLDRLRAGQADWVLAGGFDPMCEYTHAGFGSLLLLSEGGCRPFAENRDGMLLGEGYALLVLERREQVERRGGRIRAILGGAAATSDAFHLTQPDPQGAGAARCIEAALKDARVAPDEVGYISLHGTGTPFNDLSEYNALRTVFGERLAGIPASSSKSYMGHTLGAAGAVEVVISVLALEAGFAPPTLNVGTQDPATAGLDVLKEGGQPLDARVALSNSFGFGGANAVVVVGKP